MNKIFVTFFLMLLIVTLSAQERIPLTNPTTLKNKLKQQAKETTSIIADFTQEKQLSFMKSPQLSKGVFYYQQTDKMRWEQTSPFDYVLLINSTTVRIKDNGKEKNIAGANKMMGKINTLMLGMINGDIFDSKAFDVSYFTEGKLYVIILTPKDKRLQSIFNTIELSFSQITTRLKTLTFNETSGDKSIMNFFNEKFNQSIKETYFLEL